MVAWWVVVIVVLLNVALLIGTLRFVYYYMHADDGRYTQGLLSQVVAVFGIQIVWLVLSVAPVDAYNTAFDGGLNLLYFWQLSYFFIVVYLSLVLPVAVFYYEADSDPRITKVRPWVQALKRGAWVVTGTWITITIFYFLCRKISLPQLQCIQWEGKKCVAYSDQVVIVKGTLAFLNFLIALPGFLGWFLFTFQGGIGLASIPISLIHSYRARPKPLSPQQYERHKKMLGERASTLRTIGENLKEKEANLSHKSGMSKQSAKMKVRRNATKYRQVVTLLETEFELMETSFHKRGENPLVSWFKLGLGFGAILMSLFLIWEIFAVVLVPQIAKQSTAKLTLLADLLIRCQHTKAFAPEWLVYMVFTTYMVVAAISGGVKVHRRMKGFLPVEPLKKGDTHLNALLFHTAVLCLGACAVVQLFIELVAKYLVGTEAEALFSVQRYHMPIISPFYKNNVFLWVMMVTTICTSVWLILFPKERPAMDLDDPRVLAQWAKVQKQLGVDENDPGAVKAPDPEDLAAIELEEQQRQQNSIAARARNKLARFDKGIEEAPGKIFNAALMGGGAAAVPGGANLT